MQECASLVKSCHVQLHAFLACAAAGAAAALRKGVSAAVAVAVIIAVVSVVLIVVVVVAVAAAGEYSKLLLIDLFFSQAAIRWPSVMKLQR